MRIETTAEIGFPRDVVFATYRDRLPELVPWLANVRAITVTSRRDEGPVVHFVNRWRGGGEIPAVARRFVSDELLEWDDRATWDARDFTCAWQTIVPAFADAVDARGRNTFVERTPGRTTLTITGELAVDAARVKGVPRLLAGPLGSTIEGFLVAAITPNLVAVAKGVERYLSEAGRSGAVRSDRRADRPP